MPDLFDQMMGAQPEYQNVKVQGESKTFTFEVKEKSLRSTQDMMRTSGGVLWCGVRLLADQQFGIWRNAPISVSV